MINRHVFPVRFSSVTTSICRLQVEGGHEGGSPASRAPHLGREEQVHTYAASASSPISPSRPIHMWQRFRYGFRWFFVFIINRPRFITMNDVPVTCHPTPQPDRHCSFIVAPRRIPGQTRVQGAGALEMPQRERVRRSLPA
jgi:hypothetical protein